MKAFFKIKYLPVLALFMGGSMAVATDASNRKTAAQQWTRRGSPTSNTWQQGSVGSCVTTTGICKATFPDGYNPNDSSYAANQIHATVVANGYVP